MELTPEGTEPDTLAGAGLDDAKEGKTAFLVAWKEVECGGFEM